MIKKKLFVMHIPKTGDTSLEHYLRNQYSEELIFPKRNLNDLDNIDLQNMRNYSLVCGHFDVRVMYYLPSDMAIVVFFREPVSLTISAINHALRDSNFRKNIPIDITGKTLQDIIRDETILPIFCNTQVGYLSSLPYFEKYPNLEKKDFNFNEIKKNLKEASKKLRLFDFIGIFEEYDKSVACVADLIGAHKPKLMHKLNVAESKTINLSSEELDIVTKYNELDIKLYQEAYKHYLTFQYSRKTVSTEDNAKKSQLIVNCNYITCIPSFCDGFHRINTSQEVPFRWTGPYIWSGITFNAFGVQKCIFSIVYRLHESYASKLDFYVNSQIMNPEITEQNGSYKAILVYDNFLLRSDSINLEFKTDVVKSVGHDKRELGVIISNISIVEVFYK